MRQIWRDDLLTCPPSPKFSIQEKPTTSHQRQAQTDSGEQESEGLGSLRRHVEDDPQDTQQPETDERYDIQEQSEDAQNLHFHSMELQNVGKTDSGILE